MALKMRFIKQMMKSDPDSAIFLSDTNEDIKRKIKNAFCPMGITENNPIIDIIKYIIFPYYKTEITINRPDSHGGPFTVKSFKEFNELYLNSKIHPWHLITL